MMGSKAVREPTPMRPSATARSVSALVLAVALLVAACGSSAEEQAPTGPTTSRQADEGDQESVSSGSEEAAEETQGSDDESADDVVSGDPVAAPASMDEYRALWAESRRATVEQITSAGHGRQGNRIVGPAGFEVDLTACGANWDDLAGVTDETVSIGYVASIGSPYGFGVPQMEAVQAYFDWVNTQDPIGDRKIELVVEDSFGEGSGPQRSAAAAKRLADSGGVLAIAENRLGLPSAAQQVLNDACVISPSFGSADPLFADPVLYPWSVSIDLNYATEVLAWCDALGRVAGEVETVGFLISDDENRLWFVDRLADCVEQELGLELVTAVHPPTDTDDAIADLRDAAVDAIVVHSGRLALDCERSLSALGALVPETTHRIVSSRCASARAPVQGQWQTFLSASKLSGDDSPPDPYVEFVREQTGGSSTNAFGHYSWFLIEAIRIADQLPGGITRSNLLVAMRSFDTPHPALANGAVFELDGNSDALGNETVQPMLLTEGGFQGALESTGPPVGYNGLRRPEPDTTPTESETPTTSTAAGGQASSNESLSETSARTMVVPAGVCQGFTSMPGQLASGRAEIDGVSLWIEEEVDRQVLVHDLNRDGADDVVAVVNCSGGGNAVLQSVLLWVAGDAPVDVLPQVAKEAEALIGDGYLAWVDGIELDGENLVISWAGSLSGDARCCPSLAATSQFAVTDLGGLQFLDQERSSG